MRRASLCVFLAVLTVAVGCSVNPATGRRQFTILSQDQLDQMGAQAAPMLVDEYGGEVPHEELSRYVSRIGNRLARQVEPEFEDVNWEFITLDSEVVNAFALPGGRVFVSRGMLEQLQNEAQVAAVLAHEIGHVTAAHVNERISQATALDLALQLGGSLTESELTSAVGQLFGQGYLLKFGRDQELEADTLGLRYMTEAGYDPHAMLGVINVLLEERGGAGQIEFLSTHPNPETRLELVQGLLADEFAFTRDNPNYQTFEGRFRRQAVPYLQGASP